MICLVKINQCLDICRMVGSVYYICDLDGFFWRRFFCSFCRTLSDIFFCSIYRIKRIEENDERKFNFICYKLYVIMADGNIGGTFFIRDL